MALKSTKDLRIFLVKQMEGVADGTIDTDRAKGVANLSQQLYNCVNLELKFAKAKAADVDLKIDPVNFDD